MKRTSILVAAIGAAAVLGVGGTALAATTSDDHSAAAPRATDDDFGLRGDGTVDDDGPSASPSASPSAAVGFGSAVSATDAEGLALAATGGGRVIRVESETEHGVAVWSVRIVRNGVRYDLDVDRSTGSVLAHGHGADDNGGARLEPGDDNGGRRAETTARVEPGDDKGGQRVEAGDDKGGNGQEAGDDHGRHGGGDH